jgi:DNA repair exonuclease SbcCD ATPase subunit
MITTRTSSKASSADPRCPVCKNELANRAEFAAIVEELERKVMERHSELSKKEKNEFESTIRDMKVNHKNEIQTLKISERQQEKMLKKMSNDQFRRERNAFSKKMAAMKKSHQIALRNTRDIYERQNLMTQKEQEKSVNSQLKETMQNYANLASGYQKEMEKIKKMQEQYEGVVQKKEGEIARLKIGLAKSKSELQIRRLMVQLGECNASIEQLHSRIKELEAKLTSTYSSRTPTNNEMLSFQSQHMADSDRTNESQKVSDVAVTQRQNDLRDEFMTAIKEITRERRQVNENNISSSKSAGSESDADSTGKQTSSTGAQSKVNRKWGL